MFQCFQFLPQQHGPNVGQTDCTSRFGAEQDVLTTTGWIAIKLGIFSPSG